MKKLAAIPLTLVIGVTPLLAQTTSTVNFNGVSTEVGSMVQDNTTYWGVREIGKVTGLSVESDQRYLVMVTDGTNKLELFPINAAYLFYQKDAEIVDGTVEGIVADGRFYLPLRFVAEKFGMDLSYKNGIVYISK